MWKNASDYSIVLKNYKLHGFNLDESKLIFYQTWDIACGCIWNSNAIKNFYIISKKKIN